MPARGFPPKVDGLYRESQKCVRITNARIAGVTSMVPEGRHHMELLSERTCPAIWFKSIYTAMRCVSLNVTHHFMAFLVGLLRAGLCVEFYPQKVGIAGLSNYD